MITPVFVTGVRRAGRVINIRKGFFYLTVAVAMFAFSGRAAGQTTLANYYFENNLNAGPGAIGTPSLQSSGTFTYATASTCQGTYSVNTNSTGMYLEVTLSTVGFSSINIQWTGRRSGGNSGTPRWLLTGDSGSGYGGTLLTQNLSNNTCTATNHTLAAAFDNNSSIRIRITFNANGSNRNGVLDNLVITGTCITPTVFSVTGGGSYCSGGSGVTVGLSGSQTGVNYQLYRGGSTPVGSPVAGTGSAISFGNQITAGTYTVVATNGTSGCTANMTGNATVTVTAAPPIATPTATITPASCPNASDGAVKLNNEPYSLLFARADVDYINLGGNFMSGLSRFTLEGWIKFNKADAFARMSIFGQNDAIEFGVISTTHFECYTAGGGSLQVPLTSYPSDNGWHHVAVVGNGTNIIVYFDGVQVGIGGTATTNYGTSTFTTKIGGGVFDATGVSFTGQIMKVGFYNQALSQATVGTLASSFTAYTGSEAGLLAGYNFYEGTGTTLTRLPAGTNGTFYNTPVWTEPFTFAWTKTGVPGYSATTRNISSLSTGQYNVAVSLGGCPKTNSFDVSYLSPGSPVSVVIGVDNNPVCVGTGVTFTAIPTNGGTSPAYQWYKNTSPVGTNSNVYSYVPASGDQVSVRLTSNDPCATGNPANSNTITMTVNSGIWVGTTSTSWHTPANWCGGVPLAATNVTIPAGVTYFPHVLASGAVCNNLTIESAASLTIDPGGLLTVGGIIDNKAGYTGLGIKSESQDPNGTGSFFHTYADAGLTPPVPATMERYMTGVINSDRQWHLIASPMQEQGIRDFLDLNQNVHRYGTTNKGYPLSPYKESTNTWSYYFDNTIYKDHATYGTTIFTPGQGMQVFIADPLTSPPYSSANYSGKLIFSGELNNGDITVDVKKESTTTKAGWNLLGNPYPSGLNVSSFLAANQILFADGYPIYVGNVATKRYNAKSSPDSWEVPPGQGFFIKYVGTGSPVSFTNAMRSHTMSDFKAGVKPWPKIELVAETGGNSRNARIYYVPGTTAGIDNGFDGVSYYNGSTGFEIFTELINGGDLDFEVQCLPDKEYKTLVVPVGLNAPAGSTVTIRADVTGLPGKTPVYLEDRMAHIFTRLDKPGSFYSILLETGSQGTGRFYLHTKNPKTGSTYEDDFPEPGPDISDDLSIIPMPQYQSIRVTGSVTLPAKATVYDLTGRMLLSQTLTGDMENEILVDHLNNGVYLIVIEAVNAVGKKKISWIN